jgi:hypothetical protein
MASCTVPVWYQHPFGVRNGTARREIPGLGIDDDKAFVARHVNVIDIFQSPECCVTNPVDGIIRRLHLHWYSKHDEPK